MVGRTFVPNEDMGEFTVHVDTPQGTSLEGTTEIAQAIVKEIGEQEGVSHVAYLAGADRYTHFHVFFYLLPVNERTVTQDQVVARVRRILRQASRRQSDGARRAIRSAAAAPAAAARRSTRRCSARTSTSSTTTRSRCSRRRKQTPSLVDARTDYSNASPEVQVAVDRARAADLGVRMATVGNTLRLMVAGDDEISSYREAGEQYPVKIRVLENQRRDIDDGRQADGVVARPGSRCGSTTSPA